MVNIMWLQLMKRLQIIIWLLLTFHLTSLHSTTITTFSPITLTPKTANQPTPAAKIKSSPTPTIFSSSLNHNKRLHLQLQHHQYQQQQYPPLPYQNYPYSATEFMETSKKSINKQASMDQQQPQQRPIEFTSQYSQILTHKMMTGSSTTNTDNNEHNNNIIDINYNSLNGNHNRRHMIKDTLYSSMSGERAHGGDGEEDFPKIPQPYFDLTMPRNITARAGQIAAINCRVENLGDKSVSWIRKRDLHILTAGILTYTSDERFKVTRTLDRKQWAMHIKYAQPRDSGIYECQVNTEPKMSMAFRLNVIVTPPDAKASISGPTDLYVKIGSAITLTCHIKQPSSAHDIGPIHWYRGPYILTPFVVHPNDAAIDMQRISMESKLGDKLQSRLRISNAQLADSGNYTCMPTTAEAASVVVNVINDESPAAMQKSSAFALKQQQQQHFITTTIIIIILIQTNPVLWQIINSYYQMRS